MTKHLKMGLKIILILGFLLSIQSVFAKPAKSNKKAKKFLRNTDYSITDISMKCGFYSVSHFSSCFMSAVNLSPTEYQTLFNSK